MQEKWKARYITNVYSERERKWINY